MALSNYLLPNQYAPGQPQQPQAAAGTAAPAPAYMQTVLPSTTFNMPSPVRQADMNVPMAPTDYNTMLSDSLERFMDPNSALIKNARQRGAEMAAVRGGINSSIAAGASERAALDSATGLAQTATGMSAGEQGMVNQARLNEWAATQSFNRDMAMAPFQSSMAMLQRVTDASLQDPELFSPSVISGYTNFFSQQMGDMMKRYFGGR